MRLVEDDVVLRTVEIVDAEFILSLRINNKLNKYLSPVEDNIEKQRNWIKQYKCREEAKEEFYFIIEDNDGNKFGTLRAYEIRNNECIWGSYILIPERPKYFSYKSANLLFDYLFYSLNLNTIKMDVYKENTKSIHVCSKMGFKVYDSDDRNFYMSLSKTDYVKGQWREQ